MNDFALGFSLNSFFSVDLFATVEDPTDADEPDEAGDTMDDTMVDPVDTETGSGLDCWGEGNEHTGPPVLTVADCWREPDRALVDAVASVLDPAGGPVTSTMGTMGALATPFEHEAPLTALTLAYAEVLVWGPSTWDKWAEAKVVAAGRCVPAGLVLDLTSLGAGTRVLPLHAVSTDDFV